MAMKRNLKFGRGGLLLDGSGNPVRDGSGNPIMTGAGRQEADTQALMAKSKADLAADVQAKLKSDKARSSQETAKAKPAQTFGQAFAAARRAGNKTFTFKGKSFTTETKEDVAKRRAASTKKRDDADFAAEDARSKTARAVAGRPKQTATEAAKAFTAAEAQKERNAARRAKGTNLTAQTNLDLEPQRQAQTQRMLREMSNKGEEDRRKQRMQGMKAGGNVKKMARGGGIEIRGKTDCKMR